MEQLKDSYSLFQWIVRLDQLVQLPGISTSPKSSLQKLDEVLSFSTKQLKDWLSPKLSELESKKAALQNDIRKLAKEIQKVDDKLLPKRKQLEKLKSTLQKIEEEEEEEETSTRKINQELEERQTFASERFAQRSSLAAKKDLTQKQSICDLDESKCWDLLREVGISESKIQKIKDTAIPPEMDDKDPLKTKMIEWSENSVVGQILDDLHHVVDGEEASRLMAILQNISKGTHHQEPQKEEGEEEGNKKHENLFKIYLESDDQHRESEELITLMNEKDVFLEGLEAEELATQMRDNSISCFQLVMRAKDLVPHFLIKSVTKKRMKSSLESQRDQFLSDLASYKPGDDCVCIFVPMSSNPSGPTRMKYIQLPQLPQQQSQEENRKKWCSALTKSLEILVSEIEYKVYSAMWYNLDQFFGSIFGKGISRRPETLETLSKYINAEEVNLERKEIVSLPPEIGLIGHPKLLNLKDNKLKTLPPEIGHLVSLTSLDLSSNDLQFIPPEIAQLSNLKMLNAGHNQLDSIPSHIGQLTKLQDLNFQKNQLHSIPPEIGLLKMLRVLDFQRNQIQSIPPEIGQLSNLHTLKLYQNQIQSIPPKISQLSNLQVLWLNENQLESLPPEIGQLVSIHTLELYNNKLRSLPPEISQLSNLKALWLNENQLKSIPPEIGQLANLHTLYLGKNLIRSLPPEISKLTNLQILGLTSNTELENEYKKENHPFYSKMKLKDFRA